ncbi:MAG: flagellar biosynthesis anti-sigma factor FlgM [Methylocystaceae bacterium]
MIISGKQVQNILKVYNKQGTEAVKPRNTVNAVNKNDQVSISQESAVRQRAVQAAKEPYEVRSDKVEELREGIATGTYQVNDEDVAEKMIYRAILDKMI